MELGSRHRLLAISLHQGRNEQIEIFLKIAVVVLLVARSI